MRTVMDGTLEIEACMHCQILWFDRAELPAAEPRPDGLSPEAAEALVRFRMARTQEEDDGANAEEPGGWRSVCARWGLPYEIDARSLVVRPVVTLGVAILLLLLGGLGITHPDLVARFALLPSAPFRHGAMTLITHFFVHDGQLLLCCNAYFLLTAGDDVEEVAGHAGLLLLLLLGSAVGALLHALLGSQPLLGAGDGVTALLMYYSLRFPRARIGWMGWNMRAAAFLLAWIGVQLWFGSRVPLSISPAAEIGGAAVGVAFWALQRRMSPWTSKEEPPS